jgi:hypothetical protein
MSSQQVSINFMVREKNISMLWLMAPAAMPVLLPAFGEGADIKDLNGLYNVKDIVSSIDGLFLTGSPSNISRIISMVQPMKRELWKIPSEIA